MKGFNIYEHDDADFPVISASVKEVDKASEAVLEGAGGDTCPTCGKPKGEGVKEGCGGKKKEGKGVMESDAILEGAATVSSMAMSAVLAWIDGGDYSYTAFDEYVAGIADLDGNEDFSDDEVQLYNDIFNSAADAFLSLGADADSVDSFLNGEDDGAGAKIGEFCSGVVDQESASDTDMIAGFAGGDSVMESGILEASFKKMRVVRGGKVKIVKKRIGKVVLSAAQKAGLKKARRKAFSSVARLHRAKSMKIRRQHGM